MALYSTHLQLFSSKKFVSTNDLDLKEKMLYISVFCLLLFFSQYDVQYRFILITNFLL